MGVDKDKRRERTGGSRSSYQRMILAVWLILSIYLTASYIQHALAIKSILDPYVQKLGTNHIPVDVLSEEDYIKYMMIVSDWNSEQIILGLLWAILTYYVVPRRYNLKETMFKQNINISSEKQ